MSAAEAYTEETFEGIIKRKLGEPARTSDLTPKERALVLVHGADSVQSQTTRRDIIAERFIQAAERGKPWAMQLLLDRVYPRVQEVKGTFTHRSWVDIVLEKESEVKKLIDGGITLADLPNIIDVTPQLQEPEPVLADDEGLFA